MEIDPDYEFDISQESLAEADRERQVEADARQVTTEKIRNIIKKHFAEEIEAKESEVALATERLVEIRHVLDRLRACVVASYYASSFAKTLEKNKLEAGAAQHPAIQNVLRKAATSVLSKNVPPDPTIATESEAENSVKSADQSLHETDDQLVQSKEFDGVSKISETDPTEETEPPTKLEPQENLGGRHRIKKKVIVGNVSKYIPPDKREGNDKSTHKWMVYVRGPADEPRIDHFVRKVWFFLHPSYRPNDLVEVTEAPFHLTRRGWGEFPIRVQLHFCDPRNRRVDIIHNLKLDRTYTGLQTLGAETVCDVELDRSTVGLRVESLLDNQTIIGCSENATDKPDNAEQDTKMETSSNVIAEENVSMNKLEEDIKSPSKQAVHLSQDQKPPEKDQNKIVESLIKDILNLVDEAASTNREIKEKNNLVEANMDMEEVETSEEKDRSLPPCGANEKKRKRRRGDSCCVGAKDELTSPEKSLALRLLCPDDTLQDETTERELASQTAQPVEGVATSPKKQTSSAETKQNEISKEPSLDDIAEVISTQSPHISVATTIETITTVDEHEKSIEDIDTSPFVVPSNSASSTKHLASSSNQKDPKDISLMPRLRSLSADAADSTPQQSRKIVYLKKTKQGSNSSATVATASKSSGTTSKSPPAFVVLRPRSSSSELSTQKFTQTNKGNVTIITPISKKPGDQQVHVVSRKRSVGSTSSQPKGTIVLSALPEKQLKLSSTLSEDKTQKTLITSTSNKITVIGEIAKQPSILSSSQRTVSASNGKMTLSVPASKQQSNPEVASNKEVYLHLGSSGAAILPSGNAKLIRENKSDKVASSKVSIPKPMVLKSTKQGLVVVNQGTPLKGLSTSTASQPSTSSSSTPTEFVVVDKSASKASSNSSPKVAKQLSQQQMRTFKALQTVLLEAGVPLNRPVQLKVEKPGNDQSFVSVKNQQQFVLTTVTNEKGKQQLALVSTDKLKQAVKNKMPPAVPLSNGKESTTQNPTVKQEPSDKLSFTKPNSQENVPFYKMVGNKIISRKVKNIGKEALALAARLIPLVCNGRNIVDLPFCAESEADFLEWNIGKQRASELQRACLIHKVLTYVRDSCSELSQSKIPSKRHIVEWCLMRGYSIFTDEYEEESQEDSNENTDFPELESSLTCCKNLIKVLEEKPAVSALDSKLHENDDDVDIISITPSKKESVRVKQEFVDDMNPAEKKRFPISPTSEMRAVDAMANQIGVKYKDVPVDGELCAPLDQIVLAKALQLLTCDLTREALASALVRRDGESRLQRVLPERIECVDVAQAVLRQPQFEIFRDSSMGIDAHFVSR